ncbi:MAG TPA: hypothetical protein PKE26_09985 [Kiritimatiellia bacterium]|nr:hypothetical protein [Kiritimatiellia bacterium]HMO99426.1 hypothetical protein [Kiritimatiellia bacterium]HMP97703.1 hypothetical protein [Kiritimatiellia bacterium]
MKEEVVDWKTYCLEHAGEPLPPEAQAVLLRDPELKKQVDGQLMVQRLMALKRYEQPHPGALARCRSDVMTRLENRGRMGWLARMREWLALDAPSPAVAYGLAVMVLVLVGAGAYMRMETSGPSITAEVAPLSPPDVTPMIASTQDEAWPAAVEDALAAVEAPSLDKPVIMLRVDATSLTPGSGRLSFGTEASTPVSFEY